MMLIHILILCACVAAVCKATNNILFFLVDDGGFESPLWGNTVISTPHISALASKGTLFKRAYTAVSSCSPSRSAILSGLPTHQNGMYGLHQPPGNFQSNADITSLPNLLNDAGYKTGIIGKHHGKYFLVLVLVLL
jgi:N-sulfoglucosamine sulfohydrolase